MANLVVSLTIITFILYGFRYSLKLKIFCLGLLLFFVAGTIIDIISLHLTGSILEKKWFIYFNTDVFSFLKYLKSYLFILIIFFIGAYVIYRITLVLPKIRSQIYVVLLIYLTFFSIIGSFSSSGRILSEYINYIASTEKKIFLNASATWKNTKPDLIFVYMESLDRFIAQDYFSNSPIEELLNNSFSYNEIISLKGSENSIHGLIGTLCGIPIEALGKVDYNSILTKFKKDKIYCMSDLLSDNGYYLSFYSSTNLKFAGQANFLKNHSFNINDVGTIDVRELSPFGLFDRDLFENFLVDYQISYKKRRPSAVFMAPSDSHIPGILDNRCDLKAFSIKTDIKMSISQSKSFFCSLQAVKKMEEDLKKINPNAILILVSDHLFPGSIELDYESRRLLFLINGSEIAPGINNNRGTIYDIIPSVFGKIGIDDAKVGVGININEKSSPLKVNNVLDLLNILPNSDKLVEASMPIKSNKLEKFYYNVKENFISFGPYFYELPYRMERDIPVKLKNDEVIILSITGKNIKFSKESSKLINNLKNNSIYFGGTSYFCKLMKLKENIKKCVITPYGIISNFEIEKFEALNINESFEMSIN